MDSSLVKILIIFILLRLVIVFINGRLRKLLTVEKKEFFSYGHVNDTHKKIEWAIRILFLVSLLIGSFINIPRDPKDHIWFLETYILLFGFIIVSETARIIMEKRYAANRNDYIFSMIQLGINTILLLTLFATNFFGLMK